MTEPRFADRPSIRRSRWAAIGAAVAVTLGAGGIAFVGAASEPSLLVAISPERILDTRSNLGLPGPFTSADGRTLQVTGPVPTPGGNATIVPAGATAVVLNVTAVQPTAAGFLSVRPGSATGAPTTSNLNFNAGDIVPNAVTVELPPNGTINIVYDAFGTPGPTTHILVDVTGYYVPGAGAPGPPGPAGPAGAPEIQPFGLTLNFGQEGTIVEVGASRIFARCILNDAGFDRIRLFATGSQNGWFTSGVAGAQAPGAEVLLVEQSVATGTPLYNQRIDRGHMMSPDGSYLAYQQETTTLAMNVFGNACVIAGMGLAMNVDL